MDVRGASIGQRVKTVALFKIMAATDGEKTVQETDNSLTTVLSGCTNYAFPFKVCNC